MTLKRWLAVRISGDEKRLKEILERAVAVGMPNGDDEKEGPIVQLYLDGSHMAVVLGKSSAWERCFALCKLISVGREMGVAAVSVEWPDANEWLLEHGIKEADGLAQAAPRPKDFDGL